MDLLVIIRVNGLILPLGKAILVPRIQMWLIEVIVNISCVAKASNLASSAMPFLRRALKLDNLAVLLNHILCLGWRSHADMLELLFKAVDCHVSALGLGDWNSLTVSVSNIWLFVFVRVKLIWVSNFRLTVLDS